MDIYTSATYSLYSKYKHTLKDYNVFDSFLYVKNRPEDELEEYYKQRISKVNNYMIDSGAFTFIRFGMHKSEIDKYVEEYINFIITYDIKKFIELDIFNILTYSEIKQIREYIEKKTDRNIIPVYHDEYGTDVIPEICKDRDYVSYGPNKLSRNINHINNIFDELHKYDNKVHGLGVFSLKGYSEHLYRADSVDTTAWKIYRFGNHTYIYDDCI